MKKAVVLFLMLVLSQNIFADEVSKKVPVKEGYGTLDMKMAPNANIPEAKKTNVITKMNCVDVTGRSLAQGDPGFETCMMNRTPKNPGDKPTNMEIQFGQ